jgi:hypothetical protein
MRFRASRVRAAARRWQLIARVSVVALFAVVGSGLAVQVSGSNDSPALEPTPEAPEVAVQPSPPVSSGSPRCPPGRMSLPHFRPAPSP